MRKNTQAGFSILELSVVLTVISLVIGSALAIGAARMQAAKVDDTETKLQAILDTLDLFVQEYGYIPCPANPLASTISDDFGVGGVDADTGECTVPASGNMSIGVVPTATLGLPPSVMVDGWARRITYVVDQRLTNAANYSATDPDAAGAPYLEIRSGGSNMVTDKAVMVVFSHGPDGHGAWRAKGGAVITADPVPTEEDVLQNTNGDNVFVQKIRDENFDDILLYRLKWQFPRVVTP